MWAASENNAEAIRVRVKAGADIHARSASGMFTPLLFAVRGGHLDATRALLDAGADVNERLPDGMSALVLAVHNAHYELASALLERRRPERRGAGVERCCTASPGRAGRIAASTCRGRFPPGPRQLELVAARRARRRRERAHDQGAARRQPQHAESDRRHAIPHGGEIGRRPLMRVLLECGADPKVTTTDGTSALMAAAGVGVYGPGESPGTAEEAFEAVKLAFEVGGGDVNGVNKDGETALLGAATAAVRCP